MAADIAARSSLAPHHMRHELSAPRSFESPLKNRGSYADQSESSSYTTHPRHPSDLSRHQMQQLSACGGAAAAIRWIRGPSLGGDPAGKVNLALNSDTGEVLVVKSVSINSLPKTMRQLENEQAILEELRTCPRVVRLLGSAWESEPASGARVKNLFLEYVSAGSVLDIMGTFGCCGGDSGGGGGGGGCGGLPEALVRKYARGIAEGLAELHARGIVHCDVKAANVLVAGGEGETKLCGLGVAMRAGEAAQRIARKQRLQGTYGWMAPEVVRQEDQGFASDVWSFGCTVIEMATGSPPWTGQLPPAGNIDGEYIADPSPDALVHAIGYSNAAPAIPAHLSAEAVGFLRRCLERDPARRPSAAQLLEHPFLRASAFSSAGAAPAAYPLAQQAARPPSGGRGSGARRNEDSAGPRAGGGGSWAHQGAGGGAKGADEFYNEGRVRGECEWEEADAAAEEEEMEEYGWEDIGVSFGPSGAEGIISSGPMQPSSGFGGLDPTVRRRVGAGSGGISSGNSGGDSPGRLVSQGSLPPGGNQLPPLRKSPLQRSQSQPGQVILANTGGGGNSSNCNNSQPSRPASQKPMPQAPPPYAPPPMPSAAANQPMPPMPPMPATNLPPAPAPLFHPSGIRMGPLMRQISKDQLALRAAMAAAETGGGLGGNQDRGGNQERSGNQERGGNSYGQGHTAPSATPVPPLPGRVGLGRASHQRSSSVQDSARSGSSLGGGGQGIKSCLRRTSSCVPGDSGGGNDVGGSLGRGVGGRGGESGLQRMGSLTQAKKTVAFGAN
ncbi:unnamed protein product [Closterium sp. Naga37s-1]|nr:unnamed protein product [Closterium sp. Naga37s-1]